MKDGWLCPRCGRVNAPFIGHCDCNTETEVLNGTCHHQWELITVDTGGRYYICKICGMQKCKSYDPNYNGVTIS